MKNKNTAVTSQESNNSRATIPCRPETKRELDQVVIDANKNHIGYKIYSEDVIKMLLKLWTNDLTKELQKKKTTAIHNDDPFKIFWEKKYKKKVSKEKWEDMKMRGILARDYQEYLGEN